ncbi:MAG: cysteine hydrolase [Erysipelotrichaceae bacterium]|nr:cysteine hydrolase [Erysipelotrichaceae bacterium]
MNKVLVVVDMQNDFIDGSLGSKEAQSIIANAAAEIRKDYDFVVATRDTHGENYLNTNEGKHLPVVHCVKDSEGWQIADTIKEALKEKEDLVILDKPVFGSEKLVDVLKKYDKEKPIESITLIGLCTDICVVSNALPVKMAFPEIPIHVVADCCAGVTPQSHEAALLTMKMCQIEII